MNNYNLILNQIIRETLDKLWKKEADSEHPWWKNHRSDFIDKINAGKPY